MQNYSYERYANSVWYDLMDTREEAQEMIRVSILLRRVLAKLKALKANTVPQVMQETGLDHQQAQHLLDEQINQFNEQSLVRICRALGIDADLADELQ